MFGTDGGYKGDDFDAIGKAKVFLCYGAGCYSPDCFSRGRSATAGGGFDAVFLLVGEICVGRSGEEIHSLIAVVLGTLVLVKNYHGDGCAEGEAVFGSGLDLDAVFFVAGGG